MKQEKECLFESSENSSSQIKKYFNNKSIFITGATGFLGKILIEKLLRSCYDLKHIYVLVRAKKGKLPSQRLDDIFNSFCLFDKVKELHPDYKKKLIAIEGDLIQDDLGICDADKKILAENVNIVFHSAATVRFDEPLKVAVNINVIGTKKVIQLCKTLQNLEVFVHVSTAYANCDQKYITEEVFKPPVMPDKIIEAVDWVNEDIFNLLSDKIIHPKPNTYTYTKAIAEYLVYQEASNLPCTIVRPSIVGSSWHEPLPGWLDNYNGPTGMFLAQNMGFLRIMVGKTMSAADIIPVDTVINMMLAAAWYRGSQRTKILNVYNCTSDRNNRLNWGMVQDYSIKTSVKYPSPNMFICPKFRFTRYEFIRKFICFFEQLLPAYFADMVLRLLNKKTMFVKIQNKLKFAVDVLENFTTMHLEFSTDNYLMLIKEMNADDKDIFKFDTRTLNWELYVENSLIGIKKYLIKEDMSNIARYRRNYSRMKLIQNLIHLVLVIVPLRILYKKSSLIKKLFDYLFSAIYARLNFIFVKLLFILRLSFK